MSKIDITKTELVWPGKYKDDGARKEVPRVNLPFQIIETINESRATREAKKDHHPSLFDIWEGKEGETFEEGWRNKLIWGDNLMVLASLMEKFAGKFDLIYIDPPFAIGADFSFVTPLAELETSIEKEASIIEEVAYRDTWGRGFSSYLEMLSPRLRLMWELLAEKGNLFLHIGPNLSLYVRVLCDELFGATSFQNEIIWQRHDPHNDARRKLGCITDRILWYGKGEQPYYDAEIERENLSESAEAEFSLLELPDGKVVNWKGNQHLQGRRFKLDDATWKGSNPLKRFAWRGGMPSPKREWMYDFKGMEDALAAGELYLRDPSKGAARCRKRYLDENKGIYLQDIWNNVGRMKGGSDYPTQKPERLLERIVRIASPAGGLVGDFFAGSGTTFVAAEINGRRWIGCDLSRWAIHVTRKRLLGIEGCKPFEVLNLGKYERKYWQGITFGESKKDGQQLAIFQYIAFILKLYGGEPLAGMQHLHGKKGKAVIHIGAVDAPVTIDEINACIEECLAVKQSELHVLGWEWEMGLANLMVDDAKRRGVKLLLLNIPREVMEQQAVDKGDIRFFEVAHLEVEMKQDKGRKVTVALKDFAFPYADLIPEEVRSKTKKWSDYIDYWAIDWNFQNDTFMNGWVAYRTRKERKLPLASDSHGYEKAG
ncbi:MAG: site-specific DNA-methyltransferase, partial [Candidatus Binatia bacterium]